MEVLADKVHKQGEHIATYTCTFHTTTPTYIVYVAVISAIPTFAILEILFS